MTLIIFAYILAFIAITFLLVTWTLNIPVNVNKYQVQQEPLLIVTGYLLLIIAYCRRYKKLYNVVFRYQDYLVENGLRIKKYNQSKLLFLYIKHSMSFSPSEGRLFNFLFEIGIDTIKLNKYSKETPYTLISIALFSREESSLRSYTCREISNNKCAVKLVFAYLDLSSDKKHDYPSDEGARHVSLADLYLSAENRLNLRIDELGKGVNQELVQLKIILADGDWPSSLSCLLEIVYTPKTLSNSERELLRIQKEKPWIRTALKEVFMKLSIPAIERYISSKKSNAYLLTFDNPAQGHIAPHLNNLSHSTNKNFKWTNYTKNARIGLLPPECDFFELAEKLKIELTKELETEKNPPIRTELILHRLGLSGLDHYEVEIEDVTERKAIFKLRRIIAQSSEPLEILTILQYNQTFDQIIKSLLDCPIEHLVDFTDSDEKSAFSSASNNQLEKIFIRSQDAVDKEDLINKVKAKPQPNLSDINKATRDLMNVLENQRYPWEFARVAQIAESYLLTLHSIASLQDGQ